VERGELKIKREREKRKIKRIEGRMEKGKKGEKVNKLTAFIDVSQQVGRKNMG
jgi:hypothetical protein